MRVPKSAEAENRVLACAKFHSRERLPSPVIENYDSAGLRTRVVRELPAVPATLQIQKMKQ